MKVKPCISIITVVYNDKEGFNRTAQSIISQSSFDQIEWIVIDADSKDGTKDILEKYQSHITHTISEPDNGVYDGMNKGIALAIAEYILFMNAGDIFTDKNVINSLLNEISEKSTDFISGNTYLTKNNEVIGIHLSPKEITGAFFWKNSLSHQSTLIKTKKIKTVGYDTRFKIVADAKFFFEEIILKNASYSKSDIFISKYDITGMSSTNYNLTNKEREQMLQELLPPRIHTDYRRLVSGNTTLERIILRLNKRGFRYKVITLISIILYSPTSIKNRFIMKLKKKNCIK